MYILLDINIKLMNTDTKRSSTVDLLAKKSVYFCQRVRKRRFQDHVTQ